MAGSMSWSTPSDWRRGASRAMPGEPESVGDLLEGATGRLRDGAVPEPRHEALRIWADLSRLNPAEVLLRSRRAATPEEIRRFDEAVARHAAGEPLAYVTGWTGFRHLTLSADRRALIPRPETEGLVEAALERVSTGVAADVGTGTGAIALALRAEGAFDEVVGVDLSAET